MRDFVDFAARSAATGIRRREALSTLAVGLFAAASGAMGGGKLFASPSSSRAAVRNENTLIYLDFTFTRPTGPRRSRLVIRNRDMGKIGLLNGRQIGVVPSILPDTGQIELTMYETAKANGGGLLKRKVVAMGNQLQSLDIPDTLDLSVAIVKLEQGETALADGSVAYAGCCVQCEPLPAPQDCGGAVCCDVGCGQDCGYCCDPAATNCNKDHCAPIVCC
jgi:hypothetical protein